MVLVQPSRKNILALWTCAQSVAASAAFVPGHGRGPGGVRLPSSPSTSSSSLPQQQPQQPLQSASLSIPFSGGFDGGDENSNSNGHDDQNQQRRIAQVKKQLKHQLRKFNGDPDHPQVAQTIATLHGFYTEQRQQQQQQDDSQFVGNFRTLTAPTFPGRIKDSQTSGTRTSPPSSATASKDNDGDTDDNSSSSNNSNLATMESLAKYTLGRMSFNIFQPHDLLCTLFEIRNQILPFRGDEYKYKIFCDMMIQSPKSPDIALRAMLCNHAICSTASQKWKIQFTGGTLVPAVETVRDSYKLRQWNELFATPTPTQSLWQSMMQRITTMLFGLSMSSGSYSSSTSSSSSSSTSSKLSQIDAKRLQNSFHFDMDRSPIGSMDVLFLDDTMRITKGNKGSIVVVERV